MKSVRGFAAASTPVNARAAGPCRRDRTNGACPCTRALPRPRSRLTRTPKVFSPTWSSRNGDTSSPSNPSSGRALRCHARTSHNEIRKSAWRDDSGSARRFKGRVNFCTVGEPVSWREEGKRGKGDGGKVGKWESGKVTRRETATVTIKLLTSLFCSHLPPFPFSPFPLLPTFPSPLSRPRSPTSPCCHASARQTNPPTLAGRCQCPPSRAPCLL